MTQFVDRAEELAALEQEYARDGASLVILYGRRRVGKTTLISEFIKNKQALFFLATRESESQNRLAFQAKAADFTGNDLLREATVTGWDLIFKAVMDAPRSGKPVIVIDEFQYIGKSNPAFLSIFQRIWDELLKHRQVMVILCGSLIHMMESQALSYGSPLYGRRTAQIRLRPIPFWYYPEFFPDKPRNELIELYAVTGGVPKYIESFMDAGDIYESIRACVLNRFGYLYDEPSFLLQQEVSGIGSYFSLLKTIAAGKHKLSEIAAALEIKATSLTKYLKTLSDLDILEREVPVTEEDPEKSKRGLYRITDNYIKFWFLFVYPNKSFLERGQEEIVMDKIREGFIKNHAAFVYEDICRARMWELNAAGKWPFRFSKVGLYWDSHTKIDIAALDPKGNDLILGECKYRKDPVGISVLHELEAKAPNVPWKKDSRKNWYILFSANGFTDSLRQATKHRDDVLLAE